MLYFSLKTRCPRVKTLGIETKIYWLIKDNEYSYLRPAQILSVRKCNIPQAQLIDTSFLILFVLSTSRRPQ